MSTIMESTFVNSYDKIPKLGTWQSLPLPRVSRYLALTGWDYVIVDMQHGSFTLETAYECVHVLRAHGAMPWVRVPVDDYATLSRVLDAGAQVVVVPMVNTAAQARLAADAAKYPPAGRRSVGGDAWHHIGPGYIGQANESTRLVVQVEHVDALRNVDEIAVVEGVDGLFAGPVDLALSMGLPLDQFLSCPDHQAGVARVLAAAQAHGRMACVNCGAAADVAGRTSQGFQFVSIQSDADLLLEAGRHFLGALREPAQTTAGALSAKQTVEADCVGP
jgi:4-hydroxy-2-oxoheptanedioate aldolase